MVGQSGNRLSNGRLELERRFKRHARYNNQQFALSHRTANNTTELGINSQ